MFALNATEVRKDWGRFIDTLVREKPQFVKRSRDTIFAASLDTLIEIVKPYKFTAMLFKEEDGSITASLNEVDIAINGKSQDEVITNLAENLVEYAEEYYIDYNLYSASPNRKSHLPYILNVLIQKNTEKVRELIVCQAGEN